MKNNVKNPFPYSDNNKRYHSFDYYLRHKYGIKCAKITLDAGFTCPNRDGSKGFGGCTFCSARGSGDFCSDSSLALREQFDSQKKIYRKKWGEVKYIPYFQAHTNTYGSLDKISDMLETALGFEDTVGIALATRADCISDNIAQLLGEYGKKIDLTVELGLQSIHDITAERINRCHSYDEFVKGYNKLKEIGNIDVCIHIINGLPGEDRSMMMQTAEAIAALHPKFLKIHLLHIIENTKMAEQFRRGDFEMISLEDYVDITVSQLEILPSDIVIERLTGDGMPDDLIAPLWSRKKFCVMNEIDKEFVKRESWQGKKLKAGGGLC